MGLLLESLTFSNGGRFHVTSWSSFSTNVIKVPVTKHLRIVNLPPKPTVTMGDRVNNCTRKSLMKYRN